jgi:hypothetical protein
MKKFIYPAVLSILLFTSCRQAEKAPKMVAYVEPETEISTELYGSWVGDFIAKDYVSKGNYSYSNKITIQIKKITKNGVVAQSIVAGNVRPLSGKMTGTQHFLLSEPGDNKFDGKFDFTFQNDSLIGTWTANDKKLTVRSRTFRLAQKKFVYDPKLAMPTDSDYFDSYNVKIVKKKVGSETYIRDYYRFASEHVSTLNASTDIMVEDTLKNLKKLDLEIIRNAIYARHGYTFKEMAVRQFFDPVEWYVPVSDYVENQLTPLEKENIIKLKRFEKYAEDNYDTFGR